MTQPEVLFSAERASAPLGLRTKGHRQEDHLVFYLIPLVTPLPSSIPRETRGLEQHQRFGAGLGVGPGPHSSSVSWELGVGGDQGLWGDPGCGGGPWPPPPTSPGFPARGAGAAPSSEAIVREPQSCLGPGVLQYSSHRMPEGRATARRRYPRWGGGLPVGRTWREHPSVPAGSRPWAVPPSPRPGHPLKAPSTPAAREGQQGSPCSCSPGP